MFNIRTKKPLPYLPVNQYGDKVLIKKTQPVKIMDTQLLLFIDAMFETMYEADGVGLAANQVGSNQSIFIVDVSFIDEYSHIKPLVFINPKIVWSSDELYAHEEGCLSLPGLRAEVIRPKAIKIQFQDISMKECEIEAEGFFATVIQHEYDHLQGIFFTDRVVDEKKKALRPNLNKIKARKVKVDYLITQKEK